MVTDLDLCIMLHMWFSRLSRRMANIRQDTATHKTKKQYQVLLRKGLGFLGVCFKVKQLNFTKNEKHYTHKKEYPFF